MPADALPPASPRPAPAAHLSEAAISFITNPPAIPACDFSSAEAVTELRVAMHPELEASNELIDTPWATRGEDVAGVPVVWFARDEAAFDRAEFICHLHGGGYVVGSPMAGANIQIAVALRSGVPVAAVDYRLAPEHRCPAAVDDAAAVCQALATERRFVGLVGDSAGGGLSLATAVALRDRAAPLPQRIGLVSPWVDLTCSGDSYRTMVHADPVFESRDLWLDMAGAYAGDQLARPDASPLFADLSGLPPTLIQVGGREILLSDSCRLQARLRQSGVATRLDVWDGLWHAWQLEPHIPEASAALAELAAFVVGDGRRPARS